jgi:hypothetical protein
MTNRESKPSGGEEYGKGRKAGVEGTYGESRGMKGAEKTILPGSERSDGGGEGDLSAAVSRLHSKALRSDGSGGDPAIQER